MGEKENVEGMRGIRIPVPGSSGRCGATPKDDGRGRVCAIRRGGAMTLAEREGLCHKERGIALRVC
jgi:hypothetical protein